MKHFGRYATIGAALLLGGTLLYPALWPYLIFLGLNGCVLVNAFLLYHNIGRAAGWTDAILSTAVLALAQITVTQLYLGLAGYLTPAHVALAQIVLLGLTIAGLRSGWLQPPSFSVYAVLEHGQDRIARICRHPAAGLASLITGVAFVFIFGISSLNPPISFDAIFYHLVQPVEWLQTGRIPIQVSPAEALPHGPGLITTWLMLPFYHDFFARWSQIPFILLGCLASYGICRSLDMERPLAVITALGVLTIPEFLSAGISLTEPDTQVAGMVLVSTYFCFSLVRGYRTGTVLLVAFSSGLALSAKMNAFVYAVPLALLMITVWGRNLSGTHAGIACLHGLLLMVIPVFVGGLSYLYHHLYVAPVWTINLHSPRHFDITRFIWSPDSLVKMGIGGLISGVSVYGLIKCARQRQWETGLLALFFVFTIVFSLFIYRVYGHDYEGAKATRHLLVTVAFCVVLGGWGVQQLDARARRYGTGALVFMILVAAFLACMRHWPVHRLPTRVLSISLAFVMVTGIWQLLRRHDGHTVPKMTRLRSPAALMLIGWTFLLGLYGWERVYREHKYYAWPTWFGFGSSWGRLAHITEWEGARIAHNTELYAYDRHGLYAPYPLYGADLQNKLVLLRASVGPEQSSDQQTRHLRAWEDRLRQHRIDYVFLFLLTRDLQERDGIVLEWMKTHPDTFIPVFSGGQEHIYRLATSVHRAQPVFSNDLLTEKKGVYRE